MSEKKKEFQQTAYVDSPERPWAEIPRASFHDADYSPLLVHLSCKLLSGENRRPEEGFTVKFPQRATWPRFRIQPLRVKFLVSPSLCLCLFLSEQRAERERDIRCRIPVAFYAPRLCYYRLSHSSFVPLGQRSIHSNKRWIKVAFRHRVSPPIIRSSRDFLC